MKKIKENKLKLFTHEECFKEFCHVIAVVCAAEFAHGVHCNRGVADVYGANAVVCGKNRAYCTAATRIAVIIEHLIRDSLFFAERTEERRTARGGGIGLLIMFTIIYIVRQIIEPRIVSSQMNVHPLVAIIAMYAGLKIAGIGGICANVGDRIVL